MLYLVIFLFSALLTINYYISKSFLYPPTLFTLVWLVNLVGLLLCGNIFYPVSGTTLFVYFLGALAFSVGSTANLSIPNPRASFARNQTLSANHTSYVHTVLDILLLLLLIGLPFFWRDVKALAGGVDMHLLLATVRRKAVEASIETTTSSFSLVKNLVVISYIVAFVSFYESYGTSVKIRIRAYAAIILALIYGLLTGSKGVVVTLPLTLFFIASIRTPDGIHLKWLIPILILSASSFMAGILVINCYYGATMGNESQTLPLLFSGLLTYWLGGLVAFDKVVQYPSCFESNQSINRFFLQTANQFGARFNIPSLHAAFTYISPYLQTNVYTIYFSYFKDYGWIGIVIIMSFLGFCLTLIYKWAVQGKRIAIIFYGITALGIVLSFQGEHFFLNLNFCTKVFIFCCIFYYSPLVKAQRQKDGGTRCLK